MPLATTKEPKNSEKSDEPTTGLHFADIDRLIDVVHRLVDLGNTVITIEHNLDIIKEADWIVDLGPEGGKGGGRIIATGTPESVSRCRASHTGRFLKPLLQKRKAETYPNGTARNDGARPKPRAKQGGVRTVGTAKT